MTEKVGSVEWRQRVGAAIRRARGNMTQAELANLACLSDNKAISNIELGKSIPGLDTIEAIADALNVALDDLVGRPSRAIPPDMLRRVEEFRSLPDEAMAAMFLALDRWRESN